MHRGMVVFLGCLLTFTSSWLGLVFAPIFQLGGEKPFSQDDGTSVSSYPHMRSGTALAGVEIYKANGCIYCHSQQVRSEKFGNNADIQRGWGRRRSVPRDYLYDRPIMLGTMRTGPDLANIGAPYDRQGRSYNAIWHHQHLYNPRMMVAGSIMPPFKFLYEKRKVVGQPSEDAVPLIGEWAKELEEGSGRYEIVPKAEAKALVDYLLSLDQSFDLPEGRE